MALSTNAGLKEQASVLLFPPATTTTTPAPTAASMATVKLGKAPRPPRLMLRIAGLATLTLTQSIPEICHDSSPEP